MKRILLACLSFVIVLHLQAQNHTVTGKVKTVEDNSALPGVNVFVEGTTQGTITGNLKILRTIPQSALDLNQNDDFTQNPGY